MFDTFEDWPKGGGSKVKAKQLWRIVFNLCKIFCFNFKFSILDTEKIGKRQKNIYYFRLFPVQIKIIQ